MKQEKSKEPVWVTSPGYADYVCKDVPKTKETEEAVRIATPGAYEAFRALSETMLKYQPGNALFANNVASYYLVCKKDTKAALKRFDKVLKAHPDDMTAIRNGILIARRDKNVKLEKKYLAMMVKYAPNESDRLSASTRLDYLNGKK